MRFANTLIRLSVLAGLASAAAAHVPEALIACAREADPERRLACYDDELEADARLSAPPPEPGAEVAAAASAAAAAEPAPASTESEFGIEARHEKERGKKLSEVTATLAGLETAASGKRIFTLANGQIWAEQEETPRLKVAPGDTVRIKAGSLGSFRLFGDGKSSTRVERVE